ncbi:nuclear transport factor 2 family protein [Microbacterium rhizophilus]|uniref:nuclear transport factor 2 family protein n=1 Tax=Microbacterium rhizophilus TaxID=3138934 RepID=UPI0031EB530C
MTDVALPAPIQEFVDATNAGDDARFAAVFTDDAYLSDWSREFRGPEGAAEWNRTDNIGVQAHFDVVDYASGDDDGEHVVTLAVRSNRFNGTGPLKFRLRDGRISRLVIE